MRIRIYPDADPAILRIAIQSRKIIFNSVVMLWYKLQSDVMQNFMRECVYIFNSI